MLFLSPGIVYWVQTLLHWCDSNVVFIVDVSRVYANPSSEDGKKQIKAYTHTTILIIFRVVYETKDKANILNDLPISAYLWLNTNHLRNFRSDRLYQDKPYKEMINQ